MIKKHNKYEDESLIKVKNKDLLGTISTKIAYFAVQNAWRLQLVLYKLDSLVSFEFMKEGRC